MIRDRYFDWLCDLVCENRYSDELSYRKLLRRLHSVEFTWLIPMDADRAKEGIALRYRYRSATGYECEDYGPCSILELMIALAIHCEENIMDDPKIGDRTRQWFWMMVTNLGLSSMTDIRYNEEYVTDVIDRFLNREYDPDGRGCLFRIKGYPYDMRDMGIWYQLCHFLNTIT